MKSRYFAIILQAALLTGAVAQRDNGEAPLRRPEEVQAVEKQTADFYDAIRSVTRSAESSTVWVWANTGRENVPRVLGTVVGDGSKVLTKWSEIAMARGDIQVVDGRGRTALAKIVGVHQEDDLAVLQLDEPKFTPVVFDPRPNFTLGRFLVAVSPDERPTGVGVVGVAARSLREKDQVFLGIILDPLHKKRGVRIAEVQEGGAAGLAGLQPEDIIYSLGGRSIGSLPQLQTALAEHVPGNVVEMLYLRDGEELSTEVTLQEKTMQFQQIPNGRLNTMERMGADPSLVRDGFPQVVQTDMPLDPNECGGPVVDLDGKVVGIMIACGGRTRSYMIPSDALIERLGRETVSPEVALAERDRLREERQQQVGRQAPQGDAPRPQRPVPMDEDAANRMRSHLAEMQLLMERMREEMDEINGR